MNLIPLKFLVLLTIALVFPSGKLAAQNNDRRVVTGRIVEAFTHEVVPNVSVCLLSAADSSVITTYQPVGGDTLMLNRFGFFQLPVKEKGKYLIRTSCIGFKTQYTPFEVKYKREGDVDVGRIEMKRESMMLNEVTVTGTKIKMVMRGDTVVYNADAFNLAEGSMLDALIRQLPGAELNKDGEIKVNGKKIDNLLVDGRDFFEGDPKAALENLPAYTVNKIKVFDRKGKLTEMMDRDMNDKTYVMDVRLKKQYAVSTFGNIEAGGGTDDRYGLRAMASRRAGMHQLSLNANLNNLNDQSSRMFMDGGGSEGVSAFEPLTAQGVQTTRTANVGYSYGGWEDKFSAGISISGSHNNNHTDTWTSSQTYLAGGDTYARSANNSRNSSSDFSSYGHLSWSPKQLLTIASYSVNYASGDNKGSNRSAQFDADPAEYGDLLDDLFLHPEKYRQLTLNRRETQSLGDNEILNCGGNIQTHVKLWADVVSLQARGNYSRSLSNSYQRQDLVYMKTQGQRDFRNTYTDAPSKSWNASLSADYNVGLGRHNFRLGYEYNHDYNDNENSLYRLDRLAGRDSTLIDVLPSTAEALRSVLDGSNSYNYTRHDNTQQLRAALTLTPSILGDGHILLELPLQQVYKKLDYFRQTEQHLTQNNWMLNPSLQIEYAPKHEGGAVFIGLDDKQPAITRVSLTASYQTSVPDIMTMVSYVDDSDPLNVSYSNPDLHKTHTLNLSGYFFRMGGPMMQNISVHARYRHTYNAVATSMVYDKASGRTVTKPVNVDGNWNMGTDFNYGQTVPGTKSRLRFENSLGFSYNHSVDLNRVAGADNLSLVTSQFSSSESVVHNIDLTDRLTASYQLSAGEGRGNHEFGISFSGSLNNVTSSREDFQRVNAGNFSYGLAVLVQLPWKLQLNTSIANYCRRGYSDPQMNRDELIWGAKLSRRLLKNTLTVSIEGFDLLGRLSNRQYNINAQGRTETYTNVVSQYALLKLTYQFRKFPKGKKEADPFFF